MSKYKVVTSPLLYPEVEETKKGGVKVLDTYKNLEWLLSHFNAVVKFNKMTWSREIEIPGGFIYKDDDQNSALSLVDYIATLNNFPTKKLDQHLTYLSQKSAYHPMAQWIQSKPWDGVPRLDQFCQTIKTDQLYARDVIKTWMIAGVEAAHSVDGFINQGVLVIQGRQNIGKTIWVKRLDATNHQAIKEGAFLDPAQKDSVIMMSSYWIVELGELETIFKKSEIGRLKAFVTSQFDHVRFSYARKPTKMPRRSIYVATVNDEHFLVDESGNRRWWTIRAEAIDLNHELDMQQVWAEAYHFWENGASPYLSKELQELINESNEDHERINPMEELLRKHYDFESTARRKATATDILLELGYINVDKKKATEMGMLIKKYTKQKPSRRFHMMPFRINQVSTPL